MFSQYAFWWVFLGLALCSVSYFVMRICCDCRKRRGALHHFQEVVRYELGSYQLTARPDFCPVHRGRLRCLCVLRNGILSSQGSDDASMRDVISALAVAEGLCFNSGVVPTHVLRPYPLDNTVLCHVLFLP